MSDLSFPPSRGDDAEDVAWALLTGRKLWQDGERLDALVWLGRASSAATEAGEAFRAEELAHAARVLGEALESPELDSPAPPPEPPSATADEELDEIEVEVEVLLEETPAPASESLASERDDESISASSLVSALLDDVDDAVTMVPPPPPRPPEPTLPDPWSGPESPSDPDVVTSAAPTPPQPPPSAPAPAPAPLPLDDVDVFADLPDDARERLALAARIERIAPGEEVAAAGLALVIDGEAHIQPTVADATAAVVRKNGVMVTRGSLPSPLSLRIVAGGEPATIALWDEATIGAELASLPWVEDELRAAADRLQALAGATLGPIGERLDDALRESVLGRLEIRVLAEGDVLATAAAPMPGLAVVGTGEIELSGGGSLAAGDVLFPNEVLGGRAAPETARAAAGGAIVLFGSRKLAQELLVTCPPLVEALSS